MRHKNENWDLPKGTPTGSERETHTYDSIHAALLMDIRDELQTLNRVLACPNFLDVPNRLSQSIENTTPKPRRRRRKVRR